MKRITYFLIFLLAFSASCQSNDKKETSMTDKSVQQKDLSKYKKAYFASGCFWCVEAIFESVKGVEEAVSGYSGGTEANPTYEEVGRGQTHHAEAVEVYYDPKVVDFKTLVKVFFGSHDPTTLNRQGPDVGAQYRSIAFYQNEKEKKIIEDYIEELKEKGVYPAITTQVVPFTRFWKAEAYHQDYEKRNPDNAYVRKVSIPRLRRFQEKFPELLKEGINE